MNTADLPVQQAVRVRGRVKRGMGTLSGGRAGPTAPGPHRWREGEGAT